MKLLKVDFIVAVRLIAWGTASMFACGALAASYRASSPIYGDVSNAVAQAIAGDTVFVPAGAAVWTNVLKLTKGITMVGAGTNLTFITNRVPTAAPWASYYKPPLIWIQIADDAPVRVSGFNFFCSWTNGGQGIVCDPIRLSGSPIIHNFRVDHCVFQQSQSRAIELLGSVYGVIDHCLFRNCELVTEPCAGHDIEWNRFVAPYYGLGTTNTIVIEDCMVVFDANLGVSLVPAACGQGGHYVWRYNTVTNAATYNVDGLDLHGNNFYYGNEPGYTNTTQPRWRGSIWFECYSNTFNVGSHAMRGMNLRGGTCLVFGNQFNGSPDSVRIMLTEEEGYLSSHFSPLRSTWPAQDQITNSFFWGNYWNGSPTNDVRLSSSLTDSLFIQEGRDYWRRAPQATDAIGRYAPLVYPHPLVTAQPVFTAVPPPINLRQVNP